MSSVIFSDALLTKANTKIAFALTASLLLSACGAGGGSEAADVAVSDAGNQAPEVVEQAPEQVAPVQIFSHPQSVTVDAGQNASFSVAASGGGSLSYQWLKNARAIEGATSNTLMMETADFTDAAVYSVVVSNSAGSKTSLSAVLTVRNPQSPVVVTPPATETPDVEEPVVETPVETPVVEEPVVETPVVEEPVVETPVVEEPAVEEPVVETPVVEEPAVEEPAVEEPVVEEPAVEEPAVEEPAVEEPAVEEPAVEEPAVEEPAVEEPAVEEPAVEEQAVEEPAVEEPAVEEPAVEEPAVEPLTITSQPASQIVEEADPVSLNIEVSGGAEVSFQWLKDGVVVEGAESNTLVIANATLEDAGDYSVVITSTEGVAFSEIATLLVNEDQPVVTVKSIALSWDLPQEREDGSALESYEIDGYVIAYGTDANNLNQQITIEGALVLEAVVEDLAEGTYYFAIATVDSDGTQGAYSATIQQSI